MPLELLSLPSSAPAGPYLHKIPRELIDRIITHLVQNQNTTDVITTKKTIAACSLTSWIFVPSCRYAMFATSGTKVGYDDEEIEKLVELLDSPVQTLSMGLRRMRFVASLRRGGSVVRGGRVSEITQRVMEALRNVKSIHIEGGPPTYTCGEVTNTFWRLIGALTGVKEVQVEAGRLIGNSNLLEWVCELPELEELSVVRSTAGMERRELGFRDEDMVRFKLKNADKTRVMLVEIGGSEELGILRWLLAQRPVPRVRSVRVQSPLIGCWNGGRYEDGPQLVKRFFQVCGSGVGQLSIVVPEGGGKSLLDNLAADVVGMANDPTPDFEDTLEAIDLEHCDNLHSVHIKGIRVGPKSASGKEQRRALEMLLEKMFIKSPIGSQVNKVALTVQVDPHSRGAFAFLGISDVGLFKDFEWGRVPEILERGWLSPHGRDGRYENQTYAAAGGGDKRSHQSAFAHRRPDVIATARKELVMIIQGGSKHGRERLVDALQKGAFCAIDERAEFSVYFDADGTLPHGCYL